MDGKYCHEHKENDHHHLRDLLDSVLKPYDDDSCCDQKRQSRKEYLEPGSCRER